ncbi:Het-C-domain-containing protein [Ascodesmis nigricans]|uniref:Het-C-domain-containing protein n=1 Tax=Ascodesmis nigricans TaxID=341454 RepID=A0A4S2N2P2_9PEZI|nr:Het-C-domain-containing protein [Ascodesmis nigricans]
MALTMRTYLPLMVLAVLVLYASPAAAFGAGNIASISKIEGTNWRHGDIEDTLLGLYMAAVVKRGDRKKFDSKTIKRIYFGNWLRDYSQAIDTGALKFVEAGTIRILLWILSFMTFGFATGEFEVTRERLGCYRPEEHIDNPKDYNENKDARSMDSRLRGPIDEETELGIDENTGLKNYIANESIRRLRNGERMDTSAGLVRRLFTESTELARRYGRDGNKNDLYEALRLLGTGLHCLEDYSAHSNYTELALLEMGERDVFPHVGRDTIINVQGRDVYPLVTGTFGGVDFLHSVLGEVSDKAMQSELEQLEQTIDETSHKEGDNKSFLKELMSQLNIGGEKELEQKADELEAKSQEKKESNEQEQQQWGLGPDADGYAQELYPYLEFHDQIMRAVSNAMEKVGLAAVAEKLGEAASLFVFSLIAPYLLPLLQQVKTELQTGSTEVIESSRSAQHIVFHDDSCSDPTHSMLSKDHFTNVLNEPAGKIASAVLKFTVPKIMEAWDDDSVDVNRVCDEIIGGVFHHPAFRDGSDGRPGVECREAMFAVVENWWNEQGDHQDYLREALSREGVREGKNHKEGQSDCGHGCGKPLHIAKPKKDGGEFADVGGDLGKAAGQAIEQAFAGPKSSGGGGSGLGGFLGSLAGAALGEAFAARGSRKQEEEAYEAERSQQQEEYSSSRRYDEEPSYSRREDSYEERRHHDYSRRDDYNRGGEDYSRRDDYNRGGEDYSRRDDDRPSYDYEQSSAYGRDYPREEYQERGHRGEYEGGYDGGYDGERRHHGGYDEDSRRYR